ncbi:hypothetical protein TBLA_0A07160 [Henningerozyma blattae CBS 6284]|uniref:Cyclin n=1 Tax=Henningerozyma blattae (strain ATCC 34711 / CBS 6284 / DSM 70876 / NBRC 10599 / NRRL Y-10934 / UCD 77-7) TaxID=1071380 RepID=I2GWK4_HENB6|nr:hypothetical protein TBLA_0A07160 [Tetrapisispora blattae CBS 6284]CCH58506.1 hypothetical protein TBLA_0A07160 [Tetrapisispora blattae CBS 6284]
MGPSSGEEAQLVVLDQNFMKCSKIDLITLISRMLSFFIDINDSHNIHGNVTNNRLSPLFLTRFHSKVPPNISIFDYLIRLTKYSSLESSVLITSVYYIDLLSNVYPEFSLNSLTVHRYLLTATTIASKGLCDSFCTNSHYAKVGGIRCNELNVLETEFLERVRYRVIPRDNTIKLCKLEYKYSPIEDINNDIHIPDELQNSGYNVLSTYYNKMVQLVGNCKSSKNSFRNVNYIFSINQDEIYNSMPELEKPNHIIPTQQANKNLILSH